MASSELGALVDSELNSLSINTPAEVEAFTALPGMPGDDNNLKTVRENIAASRGEYFISRKRIRHDTRELLAEGAL